MKIPAFDRIRASKAVIADPAPFGYEECSVIIFGLGIRLLFFAIAYAMLWRAEGAPPASEELFGAFVRSDSRHYIEIARTGYTWEEDGKNILLVFFPLYSYLIRFFALFLQDETMAAFTVSFISYLAGLCFVYILVKSEFGRKAAWWAVVLISVAPTAFFFGVPMTESLMLLTSAATLYFIRTHRWIPAGIAGALCVFTRMVGIVLPAAAAVEFITHYEIFKLAREKKWQEIKRLAGRKGIWILLMFAGSIAYLYINLRVSGNPWQFLYYQRTHWNQEAQYFGRTIAQQFRNISAYGNPDVVSTIFIPNVIAFIGAIVLAAYAAVKKLPETYIAYALGYVFISFGLTWLLSGARYMVTCIPLFIFLAVFSGKRPLAGTAVLITSFYGLLWMMSRFISGGPVY